MNGHLKSDLLLYQHKGKKTNKLIESYIILKVVLSTEVKVDKMSVCFVSLHNENGL